MSEPKPFSLAVLKGANKGAVLRTVRKRISVGAARDNDLVLDDRHIAPRHFLVLIDAGRWRIHTLSPDNRITVDRRWSHPQTGRRGALIRAANTELLLFPGTLDDDVVEQQIKLRETGAFVLPEEEADMITSVHAQPVEFRSEDMLPAESSSEDLIELSQAATIAGDRPPDDLRDLARSRLRGERAPVAPSVLNEPVLENVDVKPVGEEPLHEERTIGVQWQDGRPVAVPFNERKPKKSGSAWDRAKKIEPRPTNAGALPEVLAQPESQMAPMPGAGKSSMSARPDFATGAGASTPAEVIPLEPRSTPSRGSNAWGDGAADQTMPTSDDLPSANRWGDPADRALVERPADKKRNAWGDTIAPGDARAPAPAPAPAPTPRRGNAWGDDGRRAPDPAATGRRSIQRKQDHGVAGGVRRTIQEISSKAGHDAATQILREPDGTYATSTRLLAARIEEFAKNLGYRAYMVTSPEPLTGKTTAAMNLAFALAEDTHRRVALMEADFRFPRFAELLGIDERQGVLGVVEGRADLANSVLKIADRNLVILPAGGRHPHPGEVLASPRFKTLIAELVNTVDIAVLDAPSVTPFADTNLLLPLVDAAFLVVADDVTKTGRLAQASSQLGQNRILGALYNHLPKKVRRTLNKERKERYRKRT
ncbi:MAG: FHA domain-containing protein [Deltaproteobacteria bacterium]|jgi:Mrp family chromosome partitioning ATPase